MEPRSDPRGSSQRWESFGPLILGHGDSPNTFLSLPPHPAPVFNLKLCGCCRCEGGAKAIHLERRQPLALSFQTTALKLGRDEVRWARSPCSPGRKAGMQLQRLAPGICQEAREVSPREGAALYGSVYSDHSTEVVSIADCKVQGVC